MGGKRRMTAHQPDTTAAALRAAAQGWPVFPLAVGDKAPPRGLTDWETRAPYNIGIATGPARLLVIDLDMPKPGQHPPRPWNLPGVHDGADVFALIRQRAGIPLELETFQVRTRRGGAPVLQRPARHPPAQHERQPGVAHRHPRLGRLRRRPRQHRVPARRGRPVYGAAPHRARPATPLPVQAA
ncbi:bifunctional DNA primase/polymerase [Nonomuraea sp. NPDC059194]|uniref:bifunctional DNA primase/polymerase n=1 Tax=Nonomuraea sp. NPDC059194 TaxID=3346764 RepID=UPI0036B37491